MHPSLRHESRLDSPEHVERWLGCSEYQGEVGDGEV